MADARRRSLIPWIFPAAMLPVFAANGALIYLALHSMPALVDQHPYEDGRTYNRELVAAVAQRALGWSAAVEAPQQAGKTAPIALDIQDRKGAPVTGLDVALRIWRPVGALPGKRLRLRETGPGHYIATVALPFAGQWQFDFVAQRGSDEFVYGRRIIVR